MQATAGLAIIAAANSYFMISNRKKTEDAYEDYRDAIGAEKIKESFDAYSDQHDKYDLHRKLNNGIITYGGIGLGSATVISYLHYRKHHKPYLPNSPVLSRLSPVFDSVNGYPTIGLSYSPSR